MHKTSHVFFDVKEILSTMMSPHTVKDGQKVRPQKIVVYGNHKLLLIFNRISLSEMSATADIELNLQTMLASSDNI